MNTPICDFVKKYAKQKSTRLHMPGHKGKGFLGVEKFDITEIDSADILYNANGIILESQKNATKLFNTAKTLYSAEGSSLSIRAMLYLTKLYLTQQNQNTTILVARNAHKTFVTAAALLNLDVEWIYSKNNNGILSCNITAKDIEEYLQKNKVGALYLTTPDYLGNILNIKEIAKVCKKHKVLLLIDNAHGAYLNFLQNSLHPIFLGADMCCDSAHKTLPVLTGGGYLHISKNAPKEFISNAENAMSIFASTSPSYLILQSLDMVNSYLYNGYKEKLNGFIEKVNILKQTLINNGIALVGDEPLKITILTKQIGYLGEELNNILLSFNIVSEYYDKDYLVLMLSLENNKDLKKIEKALLRIPKKEAINDLPPKTAKPKKVCSLKKALFSDSEELALSKSLGRVLATPTVSCPPAIPVVVCGEEITKEAIEIAKYYNIKTLKVIKK